MLLLCSLAGPHGWSHFPSQALCPWFLCSSGDLLPQPNGAWPPQAMSPSHCPQYTPISPLWCGAPGRGATGRPCPHRHKLRFWTAWLAGTMAVETGQLLPPFHPFPDTNSVHRHLLNTYHELPLSQLCRERVATKTDMVPSFMQPSPRHVGFAEPALGSQLVRHQCDSSCLLGAPHQGTTRPCPHKPLPTCRAPPSWESLPGAPVSSQKGQYHLC